MKKKSLVGLTPDYNKNVTVQKNVYLKERAKILFRSIYFHFTFKRL
jgi:hypothetical protein